LSIFAAAIAAIAVPWPLASAPSARISDRSGSRATPLSTTAMTTAGSPWVSDHACGTAIASSALRFAPKPGSFGTNGTTTASSRAVAHVPSMADVKSANRVRCL
jgi:hypothetical protein